MPHRGSHCTERAIYVGKTRANAPAHLPKVLLAGRGRRHDRILQNISWPKHHRQNAVGDAEHYERDNENDGTNDATRTSNAAGSRGQNAFERKQKRLVNVDRRFYPADRRAVVLNSIAMILLNRAYSAG